MPKNANVICERSLIYNIVFIFSADSSYSTAVINTNVIVQSNGKVVWLSHGIYKCSCNISVEYFPFDIQECKMKWASWTYDSQGVRIILSIYIIVLKLHRAVCRIIRFIRYLSGLDLYLHDSNKF